MSESHSFAVAATLKRGNLSWLSFVLIAAVTPFCFPATAEGQRDASPSQLLKKLPPPEAVARATITANEPAARDPLVRQIADAAKAMNFGTAYALSQKLTARYPQSATAQWLRGQLAFLLRRYGEAANAFQKSVAIQPKFAFGYLGLGLTHAAQNKVSAAMLDFRQVTRLQPAADIGWIGLSACAEKLGRKGESLEYARHATAVAPSSFAAWTQLAREEGISGNKQAESKALARANELRRKAGKANRLR